MKHTLSSFLKLSMIKTSITVCQNDEVNINDYCKYTYGKLKTTKVDTSSIGTTQYIIVLEDNFGNSVEKEFTVNVVQKEFISA